MPANELVDLLPGEVFVHRNVANVVVHSDLNCLSVIQFAIDVLKVQAHHRRRPFALRRRHRRARGSPRRPRRQLAAPRPGRAQPARRLARDAAADATASTRCASSTCVEQALNVCQTTIVQEAWQRGQELVVHGWVYRLHNGLLKDLTMTVSRLDDAGAAYERALAAVHARYSADAAQ